MWSLLFRFRRGQFWNIFKGKSGNTAPTIGQKVELEFDSIYIFCKFFNLKLLQDNFQ